jgi:hypothetical protein
MGDIYHLMMSRVLLWLACNCDNGVWTDISLPMSVDSMR